MESIYQAFVVSVLRSLLLVAGGWLVSRGLVEDGLMREVAAGAALIVVTQVWACWRIHRRAVYMRALLLFGIAASPGTDPADVQALAKAARHV
jgi:hypothetical protein